jgi:N-acetylglutamate synthase-like GNAT family acetyltransferase
MRGCRMDKSRIRRFAPCRTAPPLDAATLRPATAADQPLIRQWVRAARLNTLRLDWHNFLIAEQTNTASTQVVGIGQLRPHRDGTLELASLVVAPEVRGQGVGTMLVNALIARAEHLDKSRSLYLMCESAKVPYYQRFGFVEVTRRAEVPRSLRGLYTIGAMLAAILRVFMKDAPRLAIMAYSGAAPM